MKRSTITDVARESSMSPTAVSQILNWPKTHRYSEKTTQKVLDVVRRLGYIPNAAARAARIGQFNAVGLVLSIDSEKSHLPQELLFGIAESLSDTGFKLSILQLPDEKLLDPAFVPAMHMEYHVDGIISNYAAPELPESWVKLLNNYHVPVAFLNVKGQRPAIRPDDFAAGQLAVEHLFRLGRRRIAYVDTQVSKHYSVSERMAGFDAASLHLGVGCKFPDLSPGERMTAEVMANLIAVMPIGERPSAVVCYSSSAAWRFIKCIRKRIPKLCIPEEMSVIAIDIGSPPFEDAGEKPLSGYYYDWRNIGRKSAELVVRMVKSKHKGHDTWICPEEILQPPQFFQGETTLPLLGSRKK